LNPARAESSPVPEP